MPPFIPEPEAVMLKEFLLRSFPGVKVSISSIISVGGVLSNICFHEKFVGLPDAASLNDILRSFR